MSLIFIIYFSVYSINFSLQLKLLTYQEWVDMLLKINESLISNMEQLEADVAERLEFLQHRVNLNCRYSQSNELMKCRKDMDTLIKFIQHSCKYDPVDAVGLTLETMSAAQVFSFSEQEMDRMQAECLSMRVSYQTKLFC